MKRFSLTTIKSFVWRAAFIMLMLVMVSSHFTFRYAAKFTSGVSGSDSAKVAKFSYSAKINNVSALSFTNTDFWGGMKDSNDKLVDPIPMNPLRTVDFTVNNYDTNAVSEVAMDYTLVFAAEKSFAQSLAIQLFDGNKAPLLPQIAIPKMIAAVSSTYTTSRVVDETTGVPNDYESEAIADLTFNVNVASGVYTAKSGAITVTVEPIQMEVQQALYFRLWDVSSLGQTIVSGEAGELLSPVRVEFKQRVDGYKIGISMPEFIFPVTGEKQSHNYSISLTPTTAMQNDVHLDKTVEEMITNQVVSDSGTIYTSISQFETVPYQDLGNLGELFNQFLYANTTNGMIQNYYVSKCYSKNYPMNVNVRFEQID